SRAALCATASRTGCRSVGELAITRRISLVAVCCSVASERSRSHDSSLSVTRFNSFLSWLNAVVRGLFFFFETPSRAMWVLLTPTLEDLSAANYETEADKTYPGSRA